jgi:hypothetical protein
MALAKVRWHDSNMLPHLESSGDLQMCTQGRFRRTMVPLASNLLLALGLSGCGSAGTVSSAPPQPIPPAAATRLVGYLPDYDGSYATFAATL